MRLGVGDCWVSMGHADPRDHEAEPGAALGVVAAFLERDESVSTLGRLLADVRESSQGRLVLVRGEAGVGKTALVRRFCEGQSKPVRVLWGECEPLRTPRPLGPFADVAQAVGGELETLVASAARPHEVALALLRELRSRGPTVLVLEDMHWADEATLDVLVLLAARIDSAPALVLASYRDDELDRAAPLRIVLGELGRGPVRLKVSPLSQPGVVELAERYGVDGEQLYGRTGGNPFFVIEVLAAGGDQIPETVLDAVLARAARLSARARRLLEAAAVVPGQVELWLLEILAGEMIDRLEECLGSGILRPGTAHVAFRHELARLAIEEATAPNRRLTLHRAALAALAGRDADPARLAHHAEVAGDAESVVRWAPRAGERAASSGAHREAAEQYARALRFADAVSVRVRAELLERRADECRMTAQFDAAIAAQREALECYRQLGDRGGEGNALRALSRLLFFAGRTQEGEGVALEAVELLEGLPATRELAMAYANLSQRRMVVEDLEEAVAWGERALELARALDDKDVFVYALTNIGAAEFDAGRAVGRVKLEHALTVAQRHHLEDGAGRAIALLVLAAVRQRAFELARAHLEAGLEYCADRGQDTWRLYLLAHRARLELYLGRWDEAGESAASVLRDPRSAHFARNSALVTLGLLRARRGDGELAPLEEADAMSHSTGELMRIGPVAAARAEAAWLAGDNAAVKRVTDAGLSLALDRGATWVIGELAYWRWQGGCEDRLPAGVVAEPYGLSIAGEWARAAQRWEKIGCPYEAALALAQSDDPDTVRHSIAELQKLGARPAAAIVARRLRERGVRGIPRGPRPRTRDNPAGLTARELEVLTLLTDGMRNAEIAERLVVSQKTIDHHVSAILRKLDARTRGEASAAAARLGL
jgi:ATP/maltotriose-dependent transcriptional regulator MalT